MNRPVALSDILGSNAVLADVEANDKKQLLEMLAHHASAALGIEEHILTDVLWEREKLGTTGVGHGIAIPHGRIPGLAEVRGFFAKLNTAIGFDAVDNQPVDLVFLLLAPQDAGADHLHALAAVSRALRDEALCEKLRKTKDASSITKLLEQVTTSEAA
ncbi:MAG: PTS sugar transporter subunit IIA [Bdellovibrionales bacterium]